MKMFLKKELLKRTIKCKSDSEVPHHAKSSEHLSQDTQINKDENMIHTDSNFLKSQKEVKNVSSNSVQNNFNTPQNNKRQTAMSLDRYDSDILKIFDDMPFSDSENSDQSITENEKTTDKNLIDYPNGKKNPKIPRKSSLLCTVNHDNVRDKNLPSQDSEDSDVDQDHSFKRSGRPQRITSTLNNIEQDISINALLSNGINDLGGDARNSPTFSEDSEDCTLSDADERDVQKSFTQERPSRLWNIPASICQLFLRNGKCNVRNCPFRHSAPLEEKTSAVVDPFDLLENIKTCNTQEDLDALFVLVNGRILYLSHTMKSTFIVELLTSAIKFINESNKDSLSKVFYLISKHNVWNAKLCSSCIEVCTTKPNLTLDLMIDIFKSCKTLQIFLDSSAIQTLNYLFRTKVCDIYLLIDLWEYVQSDCKRSISMEYVNFIIQYCAFNVVAEAVLKRLSNLLTGIDLGLLRYHPLKIVSNKCEKYFQSSFVCFKYDQALVNQTEYLHEASTRKQIHAMVESCSWKDLADIFRLCALENNMRLVGCIREALLFQSSRFQKLADAVHVSELTTLHEMHLLGQIGIALLLEEYEKKNFLAGYVVLHSLHKHDIRYYELQQWVKSNDRDLLLEFDFERQAKPSIVQNFDVAIAAIDICIELKRLNCAYKLLNDFDWIQLNKSSEEEVPRNVKRTEYLLKLAVKLHETDYSEKSLQVAHVLLQSVQEDSSLLDIKDITTDLVHIYNELLEFLLNKGELDKVLNFYNYSKHETLNVLEVRSCILRGLVVLHATAGFLDEAWNYFLQFVIKKVYSIPVPTVQRCLILQTSWTTVELEFATKYFLNKLFPILLYKPPRVEFETWFSLRILFQKSNKESNSLTCLRINAGSVDDVVERMIHVLTSKMEPALEIETGKEPFGNIDIVPRSLYNKFCCWKKENPDKVLLETTMFSKTEAFNFEGPDNAFSFGHSDVLLSQSKQGQLTFQGNASRDMNDQVQENNFLRRNLFSKDSPEKGTANFVNGEASNVNHILTCRNSPFFVPHTPSLHRKSWNTPEPSTLHEMGSNSTQDQTLQFKLYTPQTPVLPPSASTYERNCNGNVFKKSLASSFDKQSVLSSEPSWKMTIQTPHEDNLNKKCLVENNLSQKLEAKTFRPKKIYSPSPLGKPSHLVPLRLRNNFPKSFKTLTPRNLTIHKQNSQRVARTGNAKRIAANKTNTDVETFLKGISQTVSSFESSLGTAVSSRGAKTSLAGSSSSQADGSQYSGTTVNVTSGYQRCSREVFMKIENFLKCKLLSQFKGVPCSDLESEARDMADAFISRNNISSCLDRKIMKRLVDYADERIKRRIKFQVPFRKV